MRFMNIRPLESVIDDVKFMLTVSYTNAGKISKFAHSFCRHATGNWEATVNTMHMHSCNNFTTD